MKKTAFILLSIALSGCIQNPMVRHLNDLSASSLAEMRAAVRGTAGYLKEHGEAVTMQAAQDRVRAVLKDPESARFQNLSIKTFEGERVVCGQVNAKNAYGGYVGFTRFAAGVGAAVLEDTDTRYPEITNAANTGLGMACGY